MLLSLFLLALVGVDPGPGPGTDRRIEGVAVNGSQNGKPVAGAEVILRAGLEGSLKPVARTVTDRDGHFVFEILPAPAEVIFLPGADHQGILYPGPRLRLPAPNPVKLVVFDVIAAPSPLLAEVHEIDVQIQTGVLKITERLVVNNPGLTTYVGQTVSKKSPTTLALSIPDGFERVTFRGEFFGRNFKLVNKRLETDIPWTPGKREVSFTYQLPVEDSKRALAWSANLPCALVRLRVHGDNADQFACNLSRVPTQDKTSIVFESSQPITPASQVIELQLGSLPTPWIHYLRWAALAVLACLILATAGWRMMRRPSAKPIPQSASNQFPGRTTRKAA